MLAKNNAININIMYNINLQEDIRSCGIKVLDKPKSQRTKGTSFSLTYQFSMHTTDFEVCMFTNERKIVTK